MTLELEEAGEPGAAVTGRLVAGGARAGVEPLEIGASDADSGVRRVAVSLGDTPVASLEPAEGCHDDRLPPCPQQLRGTLDVDTRRVPDGPRRLRLEVTDAAGNTRTLDPATVHVVNQPRVDTSPGEAPPGGPGSATGGSLPGASHGGRATPFPPNPVARRGRAPNGTHASARATVRAWLEIDRARGGIRRRRAVTVPAGVRVRVRGRVTDHRGRPIGRAVLAAVRKEPGATWRSITGVRTRPDGRFTAFTRVGPSQALRFVYYASGDSVRGLRSPALHVTVRQR